MPIFSRSAISATNGKFHLTSESAQLEAEERIYPDYYNVSSQGAALVKYPGISGLYRKTVTLPIRIQMEYILSACLLDNGQ